MSEIAVQVSHVNKSFKLPHDKQNSIKGGLISAFKNGKRTFETQEVLKDITFDIKKGEFFGIVGRNGSGKSTLLKMLAGIYTPNTGHVKVNGSLTPFIELGVGFNPELTGRENVYLNGALLGFNRKQMEEMYDDIVDFAELERFMDQKLKNYSSGMQVRLAFSIAIRAKSDILLIDEVLAVGDAAFQAKCFDYFYELKNSDTTVIFVSHDRGSLERFCDNGLLIDNGKLVVQGPIDEVMRSYNPIVLGQMEAINDSKSNSLASVIRLKSVKLEDKNGKSINKIIYGENAQINVNFEAISDISNPIAGLTIWKRGVDEAIYAANNITESLGEIGEVKSGSVIQFQVKLPPLINDGEYHIEIGIANESATHYFIQEKNALSFKVYGSRNPHSILASSSNMRLTRVNK